MAYTGINKHTDHFNTLLYNGNGSARTVTGVGFEPEFFWIKQRSSTQGHLLWDVIRGGNYYLPSNGNGTSAADIGTFTAASDGYSFNTDGAYNGNSQTYVGWNWNNAGSSTSVSASGSGNGAYNACTYRANTTAGFSIVQFTGRNSDLSNGQESRVTHGLGVKPDFIIIKRTDSSETWVVRASQSPLKSDYHVRLNTTDARSGSFYVGNGDNDTSTYFVVGNSGRTNQNGGTYTAYVFANKPGYSKFGSYLGNGNVDGNFVYTGFAPAFVIGKRTDAAGGWWLSDNKRTVEGNKNDHYLLANDQQAEATDGSFASDFLSNGFKCRADNGNFNTNGGTYVYFAIGQTMVGTNNIPATAR